MSSHLAKKLKLWEEGTNPETKKSITPEAIVSLKLRIIKKHDIFTGNTELGKLYRNIKNSKLKQKLRDKYIL